MTGNGERLFDLREVERETLLAPSEFLKLARRGRFPRPVESVGLARRRAAFAPATDTPSAADPSEYLSSRDIFRSIGFHGNRLRHLVARGEFAAPIGSASVLRWRASEVEAWIADREDRADEIAADRAAAIAAAAERNRSRPGPGRSASRLGSPLEPGRSLAPGRPRAAGRVSRVRRTRSEFPLPCGGVSAGLFILPVYGAP